MEVVRVRDIVGLSYFISGFGDTFGCGALAETEFDLNGGLVGYPHIVPELPKRESSLSSKINCSPPYSSSMNSDMDPHQVEPTMSTTLIRQSEHHSSLLWDAPSADEEVPGVLTYRHRFSGVPEADLLVQQFARFYILEMLSGLLFMDKSGERLSIMYLQFFNPISNGKHYSRGSAALSWLYRHLCNASKKTAKQIDSALLLVQLWAWAKFPHMSCGEVSTPGTALRVNWLKVLKNCYEALPDQGKVIVVDLVIPEAPATAGDDKSLFQLYLFMVNTNPKRKERKDKEFESLAKEAGFSGIQVACCAYNFSVVEFYKNM
ncbi:caffeic acid 3-o-methyltransferase 1 [Quercus suber]|uniref:Caffeic acid 3-o-methyltransferase 1 n=1 Tax=Quercus suber TaxID=58331 RepID=A0AAW0KXC8_QUESU